MSAPSDDPILWATDPNWNSGPRSGDPLKDTSMSPGVAAQGIVAGQTIKADQINQALNNLSRWVQYGFADASGHFGDASDGDVTLGAGVTTLTRDMYYQNLVVPVGATLVAGGFRVFCRSAVVEGVMHHDGSAGTGGGGGAPVGGVGAAGNEATGPLGAGRDGGDGGQDSVGAPAEPTLLDGGGFGHSLGGVGGDGGAGGVRAGGVSTSPIAPPGGVRHAHIALGASNTGRILRGGCGGGGGGADHPTAFGGGGGGGGGVVSLHALQLSGSGVIRANGGAGGAGAQAAANNAGGGGGGGGGAVLIVSRRSTFTGSIVAAGGPGGAGAGGGAAGAAGAAGLVLQWSI